MVQFGPPPHPKQKAPPEDNRLWRRLIWDDELKRLSKHLSEVSHMTDSHQKQLYLVNTFHDRARARALSLYDARVTRENTQLFQRLFAVHTRKEQEIVPTPVPASKHADRVAEYARVNRDNQRLVNRLLEAKSFVNEGGSWDAHAIKHEQMKARLSYQPRNCFVPNLKERKRRVVAERDERQRELWQQVEERRQGRVPSSLAGHPMDRVEEIRARTEEEAKQMEPGQGGSGHLCQRIRQKERQAYGMRTDPAAATAPMPVDPFPLPSAATSSYNFSSTSHGFDPNASPYASSSLNSTAVPPAAAAPAEDQIFFLRPHSQRPRSASQADDGSIHAAVEAPPIPSPFQLPHLADLAYPEEHKDASFAYSDARPLAPTPHSARPYQPATARPRSYPHAQSEGFDGPDSLMMQYPPPFPAAAAASSPSFQPHAAGRTMQQQPSQKFLNYFQENSERFLGEAPPLSKVTHYATGSATARSARRPPPPPSHRAATARSLLPPIPPSTFASFSSSGSRSARSAVGLAGGRARRAQQAALEAMLDRLTMEDATQEGEDPLEKTQIQQREAEPTHAQQGEGALEQTITAAENEAS